MLNQNEENKINKLITDFKTLQAQISAEKNELSSLLEKISGSYSSTRAHIQDCIRILDTIYKSVEDFIRNFEDMKKANTIGGDKYFHAKANCEAAQRGDIGAFISEGISDFREFTDQFKNTLIKKMTLKESIQDTIEDQKANNYGRNQGKSNPNTSCSQLLDKVRPNGLNKRY